MSDPRTMLNLAERASDSPYVHQVWTSEATGGPMTSVACARREIVVWWDSDVRQVALRGPETVPTTLDVPAGFRAFGIVLEHGTSVAGISASSLVDGAVDLPAATPGRFGLHGDEIPVPDPDSAEDMVERLVRAGFLTRDPLVDDVLAGEVPRLGVRSVERRVRTATGLSRGAIHRIDRARDAAVLLGSGVATAEVVGRLGYHDHPHLARSLARFVGRGATWLKEPDTALSLPYKVDPLPAS